MHREGDGYVVSKFIISELAGDTQKNHAKPHWKTDQDSNAVSPEKKLQLSFYKHIR
jgi:hypothetical protein